MKDNFDIVILKQGNCAGRILIKCIKNTNEVNITLSKGNKFHGICFVFVVAESYTELLVGNHVTRFIQWQSDMIVPGKIIGNMYYFEDDENFMHEQYY